MRALCALYLFVTINFNIDFRFELPNVNKISDSEKRVLEEIVELAYQMQVLCLLLVKALIPVWRRAVHTNERLETLSFISWECQGQNRYAISIQWIQIFVTKRIPQILPIFTLYGM